jgi:hypothetical protein
VRRLVSSPPSPSSVRDRLRLLCLSSSRDLGLLGSTVSVMTHRERGAVVAASTPLAHDVELAQYDLGEGPTRDAFDEGRPVLGGDLAADRRWPLLGRAASARGIRGAFAFPLSDGVGRYGAMTHWSGTARRLDGDEVDACVIYADIATELLLGTTPTGRTPDGVAELVDASDLRVEVYQAQGIVTIDLGVSLSEAMACLRARAFADGRTLDELAVDVVSGAVTFSDLPGAGIIDDSRPDQES